MTDKARIIFLHGASSSGKSTLARGIRDAIELPFWHISIDHLCDAGVLPTERINKGDFRWRDMRAPFFEGYHRSLQAYASAGNNLIIEHILDTPGWQKQLAEVLAPYDMFFVGVHCPLPELIRREQARGDRPMGSAEQDFHTIHRGVSYDLEVQTEDGAEHNIGTIIAAWRQRSAPSAFARAPAAA